MENRIGFHSSRLTEAFNYASLIHANQIRKGTNIPYIAHLLGVAALVLEAGGDEDQVIAALLHDAAEDQGGEETLKKIRLTFGKKVARIVEDCSDTMEFPKPPWRIRKENYLTHLRTISPISRLVSLADKLHNARSILRDLTQHGIAIFDKFNGGKPGTLWYYKNLVIIFQETDKSFLTKELNQVVDEILQLTKEGE
jgi:(p)ppGpp synthase/HD superfamily hydrolase